MNSNWNCPTAVGVVVGSGLGVLVGTGVCVLVGGSGVSVGGTAVAVARSVGVGKTVGADCSGAIVGVQATTKSKMIRNNGRFIKSSSCKQNCSTLSQHHPPGRNKIVFTES